VIVSEDDPGTPMSSRVDDDAPQRKLKAGDVPKVSGEMQQPKVPIDMRDPECLSRHPAIFKALREEASRRVRTC
jgi:hypothetical protein